jgi:hypothetical protein
MIPKFVVDPDYVRRHVKAPHQQKTFKDNLERQTYIDQTWRASKELECLLVDAGFSSSRATTIDEEYDFYINDDVGDFRMLSFVIKNPKMATRELLVKIAGWLQTRESEYSVFVTNDYDASLELFMIVVLRDCIHGELENPLTASVLGFDSNSKLIRPIR